MYKIQRYIIKYRNVIENPYFMGIHDSENIEINIGMQVLEEYKY